MPSQNTPRRLLPIAGYTLAISWAPQYCWANKDKLEAAIECGGGNRFGFTLHGLWPDGPDREWPQYCRAVPLLSESTVRAHLCATPSTQLMQHEYAKHGSCLPGTADDYFRSSNALYLALRYPDMAVMAKRPDLTAGVLATAFARVNPGIAPAMMRITARHGDWLDEIWLCLDTRFHLTACRAGQGGVSPTTKLKIEAP